VLEEGVLEGRKVFANIVKYIRMGASSNFRQHFQQCWAPARGCRICQCSRSSAHDNLLYDFSQVPSHDNVGRAYHRQAAPWPREIARSLFASATISSF